MKQYGNDANGDGKLEDRSAQAGGPRDEGAGSARLDGQSDECEVVEVMYVAINCLYAR